MILQRIDLPYTQFVPENRATSFYIAQIHSAQPWIEEFNLKEVCKDRDIRCVVGWMAPKHRMPIHIDIGDEGPTPWALDFTTERFKDTALEIYENLNGGPDGHLGAPPANPYSIPIISKNKTKLLESWTMSTGAVKFDPGKNWHTGYNPLDQWAAIVSLRSFFIEDWYAIENELKSMGML